MPTKINYVNFYLCFHYDSISHENVHKKNCWQVTVHYSPTAFYLNLWPDLKLCFYALKCCQSDTNTTEDGGLIHHFSPSLSQRENMYTHVCVHGGGYAGS